jgi:hypothetical protein
MMPGIIVSFFIGMGCAIIYCYYFEDENDRKK